MGGVCRPLLDLEGMTQGELASRLGMTQGAVSKVVHGVSPFSEELVARLALEFDVPTSFLLVLRVYRMRLPQRSERSLQRGRVRNAESVYSCSLRVICGA